VDLAVQLHLGDGLVDILGHDVAAIQQAAGDVPATGVGVLRSPTHEEVRRNLSRSKKSETLHVLTMCSLLIV